MRALRTLLLALCTALLSATFIPGPRASDWNKKTVATFNEAVEIPGQVLPAGTYVFKLVDSLSDRHIVQVWSRDETKLLATIQAIPDYRMQPADRPVFYFGERPGNSPQALREWFYPGDNYGQEFVYSNTRPMGLVAADYTGVPGRNDAAYSAVNTPADQPSQTNSSTAASEVSQKFVSTDQSQTTPPQAAPSTSQTQTSQPQVTPSTSPDKSNEELPKTASPTPLIGLIGMLSLAAALGLRQFAKRLS